MNIIVTCLVKFFKSNNIMNGITKIGLKQN